MDQRDDSTPHPPDRHQAGAPVFLCPSCECQLHYEESRENGRGNSLSELSDYYRCPAGCGMFEYERHRHRLRLVDAGYLPDDGERGTG
jgi:hypothetical protein